MPDDSSCSTAGRHEAQSNAAVSHANPSETVKRNRRLQYLRKTPELLDGLPAMDADSSKRDESAQSDTNVEQIGGRISRHLLAFYDADRKAQRALAQDRVGVGESSDEDSTDDDPKRKMIEQVLAGRAPDFPYAQVDNDASLDINNTTKGDEEDAYFGSEPATEGNTDTGRLDY